VYVVANDSDSDVEIITTAVGSSGITVTPGVATMVYSDGVDFFTANDNVLATYAPNVAVITDALGILTGSTVTDTELGYLSGVTSSVQGQLNSKFAANFILSL
jgi:hypothetical protein